MATYSWTINKLYTKDITKDGTTYNDVVIRVEATLSSTSETDSNIIATSSFDLDMNVDNIDSSFTSYTSVTEANVKTWVETKIDADILSHIKTSLQNDIAFREKVNNAIAKEDADGNATFPWN